MKDLPIPHVPPHSAITEADFQRVMYQTLNAPGRSTRVWRQNAGSVATRDRAGKVTGRFQGAVPGAADLSGVAQVVEGGRVMGLRLECEIKVDHDWTPEQVTFFNIMQKMGAICVVVRYDHSLTLAENVARGVRIVDDAIAERKCVPDSKPTPPTKAAA